MNRASINSVSFLSTARIYDKDGRVLVVNREAGPEAPTGVFEPITKAPKAPIDVLQQGLSRLADFSPSVEAIRDDGLADLAFTLDSAAITDAHKESLVREAVGFMDTIPSEYLTVAPEVAEFFVDELAIFEDRDDLENVRVLGMARTAGRYLLQDSEGSGLVIATRCDMQLPPPVTDTIIQAADRYPNILRFMRMSDIADCIEHGECAPSTISLALLNR